MRRKVFKLKQARCDGQNALVLRKKHRMKKDASTFKLHPGQHRLEIQINGTCLGEVTFNLLPKRD
jgi:hypothetical protein